jgi:hypothetical protein
MKIHCTSMDDGVRHAHTALRISRDPAKLRTIRTDILAAAESFVMEFDRLTDPDLWGLSPSARQKQAELLPPLRAALEELRNKPLDWFADHHDWDQFPDKTTAEHGAFLLRQMKAMRLRKLQ